MHMHTHTHTHTHTHDLLTTVHNTDTAISRRGGGLTNTQSFPLWIRTNNCHIASTNRSCTITTNNTLYSTVCILHVHVHVCTLHVQCRYMYIVPQTLSLMLAHSQSVCWSRHSQYSLILQCLSLKVLQHLWYSRVEQNKSHYTVHIIMCTVRTCVCMYMYMYVHHVCHCMYMCTCIHVCTCTYNGVEEIYLCQ